MPNAWAKSRNAFTSGNAGSIRSRFDVFNPNPFAAAITETTARLKDVSESARLDAEIRRRETRGALLIVHALHTTPVGAGTALDVWDRIYDVTAFFERLGGDWPVLVGETNASKYLRCPLEIVSKLGVRPDEPEAVLPQRLASQPNVLMDCEEREDIRDLKRPTYATMDRPVDRQICDVLAFVEDSSSCGLQCAAHEVEEGRLACPVGAVF